MAEEFQAANAGAESAPAVPATPNTETTTETSGAAPAGQQTEAAPGASSPAASQQDVTQTQAFARRLKEETDKRLNDFISSQGYTDAQGNPIQTYEAYQSAVQAAETAKQNQEFQQQTGIDPESLLPLFDKWKQNDPDFRMLRQEQSKAFVSGQLSDFEKAFPGVKIDRAREDFGLPNAEKISQYLKIGNSLTDAYRLANFDSIAKNAQQSAVSQILQNGQASPGSLSGGSQPNTASVWEMSEADFKKMQQRALNGELTQS